MNWIKERPIHLRLGRYHFLFVGNYQVAWRWWPPFFSVRRP
jgi:hypothetical protein